MEDRTKYHIYQKTYNAWNSDPQVSNLSYPEHMTDYVFTCTIGDLDVQFKLQRRMDLLVLEGIKKCPGMWEKTLAKVANDLTQGFPIIQAMPYNEQISFKYTYLSPSTPDSVIEQKMTEGINTFLSFAKKAGTTIVSAGNRKPEKPAEAVQQSSKAKTQPIEKSKKKTRAIDYSVYTQIAGNQQSHPVQKSDDQDPDHVPKPRYPSPKDAEEEQKTMEQAKQSKTNEQSTLMTDFDRPPNETTKSVPETVSTPSSVPKSSSEQTKEIKASDAANERAEGNAIPQPSEEKSVKPQTVEAEKAPEPDQKNSDVVNTNQTHVEEQTLGKDSFYPGENKDHSHLSESENYSHPDDSKNHAQSNEKAYAPAVAMQMREMLADMDKLFKQRKEAAEYREDTLRRREAVFNDSMGKREKAVEDKEASIQQQMKDVKAKLEQWDIKEAKFQAKVQELTMQEQTLQMKEQNLNERESYIHSLEQKAVPGLSSNTEELKKLEEENAALQTKLSDLSQRSSEFENKEMKFKQVIEKQKKDLEANKQEASQREQELLQQIQTLQHTDRIAEGGMSKEEADELVQEYQKMQVQNTSLRDAYEKLEKEATSLKQTLQSIGDPSDQLKTLEIKQEEDAKKIVSLSNELNVYKTKAAGYTKDAILSALKTLHMEAEENEYGDLCGETEDVAFLVDCKNHVIRMDKNIRRGARYRNWAREINDTTADSCILTDKQVIYKRVFENFSNDFSEMLSEMAEL